MPLSVNSELSEVQQIVQLHRLKQIRCADCLQANILINALPDEAIERGIEVRYLKEPIARVMGKCASGFMYNETSCSRKGRCTNPEFNNPKGCDPTTAVIKSILDEADTAQNGGKGQE